MLHGQAMFQSREQETGKAREVDVREDHGGMSVREEPRFLKFRMHGRQEIRRGW